MSQACETFAEAIRDAENLLGHFNQLNSGAPSPDLEVLKRAGLVMAMTAWETYVEDRVAEACHERLSHSTDSMITQFMAARLKLEIKRLNNPDSAKTLKLFKDFGGVDLREAWSWNNFDADSVRTRLDCYIKKRGEVVHRSRPISQGVNKHAVKKDELEKAIAFLKNLVDATERALASADEARTGTA